MVHERALVVRPEEDELAIELEQVAVLEARHGAVGDGVAVTDHTPQTRLGRKHLGHRGATLQLAGVVAEGACENDRHRDDRQQCKDTGNPERAPPRSGSDTAKSSSARSTAPKTTAATVGARRPVAARPMRTAAPGSSAQNASSAMATRPPARTAAGSSPSARKRDAVPSAEQREADGRERSSPEDETSDQHCQPRHGDARRSWQVSRRQPHGKRKQRRAGDRGDPGRYARIALAKRLNADTSSSTGSSGSPKRHWTTGTPSLRKRLRMAARRSFQMR